MFRQLLWRSLASISLGLGALGIVLPGLPTTPFLLVAAWAGSRGWPALEARLLAHERYGPLIRDWRNDGAVPRKAKWLASALMVSSVIMIWLSPAPDLVRWLLPAFLLCVAIWLWAGRRVDRLWVFITVRVEITHIAGGPFDLH